jgi:hypothetical protein
LQAQWLCGAPTLDHRCGGSTRIGGKTRIKIRISPAALVSRLSLAEQFGMGTWNLVTAQLHRATTAAV